MRNVLLLLGLISLLAACDGLERSVDDSALVPTTDLPTITSFISPQDTVLEVRVEKTIPAVGTQSSRAGEPIRDAVVTITDGVSLITLRQNLNYFGIYQTTPRSFSVEAGKTYSLRVIIPDGRVAEASCTIPVHSVDRSTVSLEKSSMNQQSSPFTNVSVKWQDRAGEPNYYALYHYYYSFYSGDKVPSSSYQGIRAYYDDTNRDGQYFVSKPISVQPDSKNSHNMFILCLTDKLYYDYHKAIEASQLNKDNPFADPIRMPTNVRGGYGLFTGYNRLEIDL